MNLALRPATEADFELLFDFRRQALQPYLAARGDWHDTVQREKFSEHFTAFEYQVVLGNGTPVGHVAVARRDHEIYIADLCVAISARGRGIASHLMRDVKIRAHQLNLPVRIHVDPRNLDAQDFCELQQFHPLFETESGKAYEWLPELAAEAYAA